MSDLASEINVNADMDDLPSVTYQNEPLIKSEDFKSQEEEKDDDNDENSTTNKTIISSVCSKVKFLFPWFCLSFCVLCLLAIITVLLVLYAVKRYPITHQPKCKTACLYSLVETIPTNLSLEYKHSLPSHEVALELLNGAKDSIYMLEFYFDLNNTAVGSAKGNRGVEIMRAISRAARRGVEVEIIYNREELDFSKEEVPEVQYFKDAGVKVTPFSFNKYFGGVLHTKMLVVDDKDFYLGSANMDWKSYSQVKELGIYIKNCECLAGDVKKVYEISKSYVKNQQIDQDYDTAINLKDPIKVEFEDMEKGKKGNKSSEVFFSASPIKLNSEHRTSDIEALKEAFMNAEKFAYISVMDFLPFMVYQEKKEYWGELVEVIKESVIERSLTVNLLISRWNHTKKEQTIFLRSLKEFGTICQTKRAWCSGSINIKEFVVPADPNFSPQYNYTRVNHNKYLVTDKKLFLSTSNWSKDYFYTTQGISFNTNNERIRKDLIDIFIRDWTSDYAHDFIVPDNSNCKPE